MKRKLKVLIMAFLTVIIVSSGLFVTLRTYSNKQSFEDLLGFMVFQKYKPIKEVHSRADCILYKDADELESKADLIIVATPTKEFNKNSVVSIDFSKPDWTDLYTVTDLKIVRVIKGQYSDKEIQVIEPAVITNSYRFGATWNYNVRYIIREYYFVMEKDKRYVLFLRKTDLNGAYSIMSLEQGKFNIDGADLQEKAMSERNQQYRKLKEDVLRKLLSYK